MKLKLIKTEDYLLLIDKKEKVWGSIAYCEDNKDVRFIASHPKYDETGLKILAYFPLKSDSKELDFPLLPKYDLEGCSIIKPEVFTSEDMLTAIKMAREGKTCIGGGSDYVEDGEADDCVDWYHTDYAIIQSLYNKRFPKEFIPKYDTVKERNGCDCLATTFEGCSQCSKQELRVRANLQDKQELVGTYVY